MNTGVRRTNTDACRTKNSVGGCVKIYLFPRQAQEQVYFDTLS